MSLEPSFNCLYRRSRYSRTEDEQPTGSRQHRRELFAVAAVGFVLKHDEKFRAHFLGAICGFAAPAIQQTPKIEVQPHDHSDLAIKDEAGSSLYIIEFKVGAPLEEKQSPKNEEAFFGDGGYGTLVLNEGDYRSFTRKSYVVLDDSKAFKDGGRRGLECKSRVWSDLIGEGKVSTGLWADLLDSLGELGVTAFQFQRLRNMNNAQHTKEAVAMHQTLSAVASRWKLGPSSGSEPVGSDGDETWYGRNIPGNKSVTFLDLEMCVQPAGSLMGWFGYESGLRHCERAFWFYCGSEEAARRTHKFILERVRPFVRGTAKIEGTDVWFQLDGCLGVGDAEWFDSVFMALAKKKAGQPK